MRLAPNVGRIGSADPGAIIASGSRAVRFTNDPNVDVEVARNWLELLRLAGLEFLCTLDNDTHDWYGSDDPVQQWRLGVARARTRYGDYIRKWQILNEIDAGWEVGQDPNDPDLIAQRAAAHISSMVIPVTQAQRMINDAAEILTGRNYELISFGHASGHPEFQEFVNYSVFKRKAAHPYAKEPDSRELVELLEAYEHNGEKCLVSEYDARKKGMHAWMASSGYEAYAYCWDTNMNPPFGMLDNGVPTEHYLDFTQANLEQQEKPRMTPEQIVHLSNRVSDEYSMPRVVLLGCAIAESDLDDRARRPTDPNLDSSYWPDVSAGTWQQTVRWANEYLTGDLVSSGHNPNRFPGNEETARVLDFYYDPEHAAYVAAPQIKHYLEQEGNALDALCRYNWPEQDPELNPNRANYQRGLREAAEMLGEADEPSPGETSLTYDPWTPVLIQPDEWQCSVYSLTMAVHSIGSDATAADVRDWMGPRVTQQWGLMDSSGRGLVDTLHERGLGSDNISNPNHGGPGASWEDVITRAGKQPLMLGGTKWGHWTFVREYDAERDILYLGNPAPSWKAVGQEMDRGEFEAWGEWSLVWIELGEDPEMIKELQDKVNGLVVALAHTNDVVLKDLDKKGLTLKKRVAMKAEAKRIREQFIGPAPT